MAASWRCRLLIASLLSCGASALKVTVSDEGLAFSDHDGATLLTNSIFSGAPADALAPVQLDSRKRAAASKAKWTALSENAVRVNVESEDPAAVTTAAFSFVANEIFYGVWEYPWNGTITNQNVNFEVKGLFGDQPGVNYANARAPFFFTRSGFGVYVDTLEMGSFHFSSSGANFTFGKPSLAYNVLYNRNLKELLMQYANMSSKPSLPPDSGYGPIFWSDNILTDFHGNVTNAEQNLYDIVDNLYFNKIRATGMFADRPYGTGNMSFGNFDFDPAFFPDPKAFIANISNWGYDFQVWVANRAFLNTTLFKDANASGWLFPGIDPEQFLGPALNLSIPAAYEYFLGKLKYFTDLGVKGYKIDRGEEHEMPDSAQNIQNTLFDELCHKSMVDKWGEGNFFTFTRSAVDRARSKVAIWNGDPQATFEGLRYSVASGIRAGLLLFSTWGSDIGGYLRSEANPSEELWARWMQFGAFSPMYEIMVGTGHTPWYQPYTGRLMNILQQTAAWHTRLIPYIKSYTYQATQTGIPVMRALFLEFPTDDLAYTIADEYAFGEHLLVAPFVTEGGARTVFFPKGAKFLEYFGKANVYAGGTNASIAYPLEAFPVYVREGAIVPTGDIYRGNAKWIEPYKPFLEIEFFPSYNVNVTRFPYLKADGNVAVITATTNRTAETVRVSYEDLGVDGRLLIYSKSGVANITMPPNGGSMTVTLDRFASLFDETRAAAA